MAFCPDYSDSDHDSLLSDDCDYQNFKERIRDLKRPQINTELTETEQKEHDHQSLFSALSSGNVQGITELLDKGIDVNAKLRDDWTPILLAASYGNPEIILELIQRGADVNSSRDGNTALMMASKCPDCTSPFQKTLEVIRLLVEAKANPKIVNRKRMDALMFAANNGNLEAVKYLLPLSETNLVDNQKWTALFWAVFGNHVEVVKFLLDEGFDSDAVDVRGDTPIDLAKNNEFQEILKLFPDEESDIVSNIIDSSYCTFEDNFKGLKKGKKPKFYLDVCNILCSVRADFLIPKFSEKNVGLYEFLSMCDDDIKDIGVLLPYQRNRILAGLHRFHKHPYLPKSLHVVPLKDCYSNLDVAAQLLSSIKHLIAMEASLKYMMKNYTGEKVIPEDDLKSIVKNLENIKSKIRACKAVTKLIISKTRKWDQAIQPPDLVTKMSIRSKIPWRKIIFSCSVVSVLLIFKGIK